MDWLQILVNAVITGISGGFCGFLVAKLVKRDMKNELFDFFESKEGLIFISTIGRVLAVGAMSAIGKQPRGKTMNIFGLKVPSEIVMTLIEKSGVLGKIGKSLEGQGEKITSDLLESFK